MKLYARLALLWLASVMMARAADDAPACAWHEEAVAGPAGSTSLKLLGTTPDSGAEARRDTVLAVDFEYQIDGFAPDSFFPAVLFRTIGQNSVSSHQFDKPHYFEHAAGIARLCVPLAPLYGKDTVHWPLDASVMLMQKAGSGSASVSNTIDIKFQSPDAPMAGIRRNSQRPPEEYFAALELASRTFTNREARFEVCRARFPARQQEFAQAHVPWEARYHEDIALVAQAQFDVYLELNDGSASGAKEFAEMISRASLKYYELLPDASLKKTCDEIVAESVANPGLVDDLVAGALATVRKYAPGPEASAR